MDALYKRLNGDVEKIQGIQKELQKCFQATRQLSSQLTENTNVKDDLEHLDESNKMFKLVGPVLVQQELTEAKETVAKRISYIESEKKRQDDRISDLEKQQEEYRSQILKLQQQIQQEQTKAALKA